MNTKPPSFGMHARKHLLRAEAPLRILIGVVLGLALGAGLTVAMMRAHKSGAPATLQTSEGPMLSENTLSVLQHLQEPLEMRFYSILDPSVQTDKLRNFVGRVSALLAAYQKAGAGRVTITQVDANTANGTQAAAADGVQAFNQNQGDACFLGFTVTLNGQHETISKLSPDWETAVEADLTRAIARLEDATRPIPMPVAADQIQKSATEVRQVIPDPASVSFEDGVNLLKVAALKNFEATAKTTQAEVEKVQQQLAAGNLSDADQQSTRQKLQGLQMAQAEQLQQIAARVQTQIEAFRRLKSSNN